MVQNSVPAAPRATNPFGIASLVFGVLLVLAGVATVIFSPAIPILLSEYNLPYRYISLLISLPQAVLALLATALGVVGLLVKGRRRVGAIIGTTLGAAHLITALMGLVGSQVVVVLLG